MVICVRNCCGAVKYVPLYEYVFRLADHILPQDGETVSDKLRYYRIKCGLFQKDMEELLKKLTGVLMLDMRTGRLKAILSM